MKKIILNSFLVFLIIGCTSTIPTPTLIVNTSTPIVPTLSPTATLEPSQVICNKVRQVDVSEVKSQGKMIFTSLHYQGHIVNANNFEQIKIDSEEDVLFSISISPNRQLTAYQLYSRISDDFTLVVTRFDGISEIIIPWEEDWSFIASWLDNERILIKIHAVSNEKTPSTFVVVNPFIKEKEFLPSLFPNIYSHHMFYSWTDYESVVYHPTLDYAVYLRADSVDADWYYVLWDVKNNQKIIDFPVFIEPRAIPLWSPDSNSFAMAPSLFISDNSGENWPAYNLYVVDLDGKIEKITNLIEYFRWFYIGRLNWSPDGEYIAFWFSGWNENPDSFTLIADQYLGVVEVETKSLKIYCISGNAYPSGVVPPPIWSPDGTQIIVESPLSNEHSQVILLDLEKEVIAKIGEDMIPVGWMIEP